jgi:hypothetical protein
MSWPETALAQQTFPCKRNLLGRLVSSYGDGILLRNFGNYLTIKMTSHPKILVPFSRIAVSFSNLAALNTAFCSKLGTLLKSQNNFLKHKAFYRDRLRQLGIELYFRYFGVEVDFIPEHMPFASENIL